MLEFAAIVRVPESDVVQGKATPGLVDAQAAGAPSGPPLRVLVTDAPPQDAYVAVQYDRRWFWIADTDLQSKNTFAIIMLLFSIADTGIKGRLPSSRYPPSERHTGHDYMRTKPITAEPIGISAGIARRIGARRHCQVDEGRLLSFNLALLDGGRVIGTR
jgi:hypothetical protein